MKFVLTMDMPSSQGSLVHQITIEHPAKSVNELCEELNKTTFMTVKQFYKDDALTANGEIIWIDRGDIGIHTDKIGKVQIHGERPSYDKPRRNTGISRSNFEGTGRPVRGNRTVL